MSVRKKLLNSVDGCVDDMLLGVEAVHPGLSVSTKARIVMFNRGKNKPGQVGLISGGGSGHEPFSTGYVGKGMLTAAVAGSVFASPPPQHIITAIRNVASVCDGGVIVYIMNYTGDVLNFGLAIETAKKEGLNVEKFIFGEDCAQKETGIAGKRGMCGNVLLFKICGALAGEGKCMKDLLSVSETISANMATMGICLSACSLPGSPPLFSVPDDSMELGIGVHGEAGTARIKMCSAAEVVDHLLKRISETLDLQKGEKVVALLNNLGSTSQLELYVVAREVHKQLRAMEIEVMRFYAGAQMTSLDMSGVQVSVLKITNHSEWLQYLDCTTDAFAWPGKQLSVFFDKNEIIVEEEKEIAISGVKFSDDNQRLLKRCLFAVAKSIQDNEQKLNQLDSGCGDGDTGSTLRRLADAIIQNLDNLQLDYPSSCLRRLARIAEDVMGGTSGAIYSLLFIGAASEVPNWVAAWKSSLDTVMKYSAARVGHRSMMDALIPAFNKFEKVLSEGRSWKEALQEAVIEAENGCEKTLSMTPKCGRASYVDSSNIKDVDAGAYGVVVWLKAIQQQLLNDS